MRCLSLNSVCIEIFAADAAVDAHVLCGCFKHRAPQGGHVTTVLLLLLLLPQLMRMYFVGVLSTEPHDVDM
jgi:hypothetical protein